MLDILQVTPDIIAQVADSTEFISEPMRALLDSISAKTGQTALNTARDSVDWEVIQITRRDYYIAVVAIIVATISLIVDIFTTINQHTSSSNSKLLSAKLTLRVQKTIAIDMIYRMYRTALFWLALKQQLIDLDFKYHPSPREINRCKINNDLELDALCSKDTNLLNRWKHWSHSLEYYNSDCDSIIETLNTSKIPNEYKLEEISNITKSLTIYAAILHSLTHILSEDDELSMKILDNIQRTIEERYQHQDYEHEIIISDEVRTTIEKMIDMLHLYSYGNSKNDTLELMLKDFRMIYSRRISMIPIND